MKTLTIISYLIFASIIVYLACTDEALFNPTGETGITVYAFVCDTTGLDTTITQFDSTLSINSSLAGQAVTFLGFKNTTWFNNIEYSSDYVPFFLALLNIAELYYSAEFGKRNN